MSIRTRFRTGDESAVTVGATYGVGHADGRGIDEHNTRLGVPGGEETGSDTVADDTARVGDAPCVTVGVAVTVTVFAARGACVVPLHPTTKKMPMTGATRSLFTLASPANSSVSV
jgi:hypothetical protein